MRAHFDEYIGIPEGEDRLFEGVLQNINIARSPFQQVARWRYQP
jgi:hypothetical protein